MNILFGDIAAIVNTAFLNGVATVTFSGTTMQNQVVRLPIPAQPADLLLRRHVLRHLKASSTAVRKGSSFFESRLAILCVPVQESEGDVGFAVGARFAE